MNLEAPWFYTGGDVILMVARPAKQTFDIHAHVALEPINLIHGEGFCVHV